MILENCVVRRQSTIAKKIIKLELSAPKMSRSARPGQFVHIDVGGRDTLLRRPLSVSDVSRHRKTLTLIYRIEGEGTKHLAKKSSGEKLSVLGPLGNGFPERGKRLALLVGGGVGVPPLYFLARRLREKGVQTVHLLGFRTKEEAFLHHEFRALGLTHVYTDDASLGRQGQVTEGIVDYASAADVLYACGPLPMLKAVQSVRFFGNVYLSLETRMGCAVGACLACVIPAEDGTYRKICTDGPVFSAKEVVL